MKILIETINFRNIETTHVGSLGKEYKCDSQIEVAYKLIAGTQVLGGIILLDVVIPESKLDLGEIETRILGRLQEH